MVEPRHIVERLEPEGVVQSEDDLSESAREDSITDTIEPAVDLNELLERAPKQENGKVDFNRLIDSDSMLFAMLWEERSGKEATKNKLQVVSDATGKKIDSLRKKLENETDFNKIADFEDGIADLLGRKEKIDSIIRERYESSKSSPEKPPKSPEGGLSVVSSESLPEVKSVPEEGVSDALEGATGDPGRVVAESGKDEGLVRSKPVTSFQRRLNAVKDGVQSVREQVLYGIASGSYKFRWKDDGVQVGLGSELGLSGSNAERLARINILSNNGYTPNSLAHELWENGDHRMDDAEIRDEILDVLQSVTSRRQALEVLEESLLSQEERYIEALEAESAYEAESMEQERALLLEIMNQQDTEDLLSLKNEALENGASVEQLAECYVVTDIIDLIEQLKDGRKGQTSDRGRDYGKTEISQSEGDSFESVERAVGQRERSPETAGVAEENQNGSGDGVSLAEKGFIEGEREDSDTRGNIEETQTIEGKKNISGTGEPGVAEQNRPEQTIDSERQAQAGQRYGVESIQEKIEKAEAETNIHPTDAQKEAGNYKKGYVTEGDVFFQSMSEEELEAINDAFNGELDSQIAGTLDQNHVYELGRPSAVLQSAGIPNLPIELRASRLNDKSMQENHPFDLVEVRDLPKAVQSPLAVFRSATHLGSYVIMTELVHGGRNYVVALDANRRLGKIRVNSIRSIYPKNNNQVAHWIDEGLLEYVDQKRMTEWLSKQQSNSADVGEPSGQRSGYSKQRSDSAEIKKLFGRVANIVNNFENSKLHRSVNQFKPISERKFTGLIDRLQKTGLAKEVVTDRVLFDEKLQEILDGNAGGQVMRVAGDDVYGFVTWDGVVYLDSRRMNANTPIHEFGHLWNGFIKSANPTLYNRGIELVKQSPYYWEQLNRNPAYSSLSEAQKVDEALAMAIGDNGEAFVNRGVRERFMDWLSDLWESVKEILGIESRVDLVGMSLADFTDVATGDLLGGKRLVSGESGMSTLEKVGSYILSLFNKAKEGPQEGKNIRIGKLTDEGKRYLGDISGLDFREYTDFVLNMSDLRHIYKGHFGENEKDKGSNYALTDHDIERLGEVIAFPDRIIFMGVDRKKGVNQFAFLKEADAGTYNLVEVYSSKRGKLTAKSYYKTKKGINQRAYELDPYLSTSETDGAYLSSETKIPQLIDFEKGIVENNSYFADAKDTISDVRERFHTYRTQDGRQLAFRFAEASEGVSVGRTDGEHSHAQAGSDGLQRQGDTLLRRGLRRLEPGEFSHVERVFTESKHFSFTAPSTIESVEDVVYIFSELENESVENSFVVYVKDGAPIVQHLSIGTFTGTPVNYSAIHAAYSRINPDQIYFIHNHPSGNLFASREDINVLSKLQSQYGEKVMPGIIINLRTGKYGTYDASHNDVHRKKDIEKEVVPVSVYSFNKQVFGADYDPSSLKKVTSSQDVASFISGHRLGERKKINVMLISRSGGVVGNFFTPYTEITDGNMEEVVRHFNDLAVTYGGAGVIPYGNFRMSRDVGSKLKKGLRSLGGSEVSLLDIVDISGDKMFSYGDEGLLEPPAEYNRSENEVREDSPNPVKKSKADKIKELRDERNRLAGQLKRAQLSKVRKDERLAKVRETALDIERYINDHINRELVEWMGIGEFKRLISKLHSPTSRKDVDAALLAIDKTINDIELRRSRVTLDNLLKTKVLDRNQKGVSVAKTVDESTRASMEFIRGHKQLSREEIAERISEINEQAQDGVLSEEQAQQIADLEMVGLLADIAVLRNDLDGINEKIRNGVPDTESFSGDFLADRVAVQKELIGAYGVAIEQFTDLIETGKAALIEFKKEEIRRQRELGRMAIEAVKKNPILSQGEEKEVSSWKKAGDWVKSVSMKTVLSPLGNLNFMLKFVDQNHPPGLGPLYKRFFKHEEGVTAAYDANYRNMESFRQDVKVKMEEVFGVSFDKVLRDSKKDSGYVLWYETPDEVRHRSKMSKGELLYVYMVSRMEDGLAKLNRMGVTDGVLLDIEEVLGDRYVRFADWVQKEFLPERRKVYNDTHKRIFGTSMAKIENYFPLIYDMKEIKQEVDVGERTTGFPSTMTGSIINRRKNNRTLSLHSNAFQVLMEHGEKMEEWNAYAQVRKDLNGLLSNRYVRNLIDANDSASFEMLEKAVRVAVKSYSEGTLEGEEKLASLNRLIGGGKIAFRFNTAIKQLLSYPAFFDYSSSPEYYAYLVRNLSPDVWVKNRKWALERLPGFKERWKSGNLGDEKLKVVSTSAIGKILDGTLTVGMYPNRFIDAFTVVAGTKGIYDYAVRKYARLGYKEASERMALFDAMVAYNESQQSSRDEFLSPMQKSKSFWNRGLSLFQNSNFSFMRKFSEGVFGIMRHVEHHGAMIDQLTKEYEREGLSYEQAHDRATKDCLKSVWDSVKRIGIYGVFLQFVWKTAEKYLWGIWDDEDEKKKDIVKALATAPIQGLYGGAIIDQLANGYAASPLLIFDDFNKTYRQLQRIIEEEGVVSASAGVVAAKGMLQLGGIDFNTFESIYTSIADAVERGDVDAITIQQFLNTPVSIQKGYAGKLREGESLEDYARRVARAYADEKRFKGDMKKVVRKYVFSTDEGDMTAFNRAYEKAKQWEKLKKDCKGVPDEERPREYFDLQQEQVVLEAFLKKEPLVTSFYSGQLKASDEGRQVGDSYAFAQKMLQARIDEMAREVNELVVKINGEN